MCILPIIKYYLVASHETFFFHRLVIKKTVETFEKKYWIQKQIRIIIRDLSMCNEYAVYSFTYEWLFRLNT